MTLLNDLALWLWRLLPGNPIILRVVSTGGKRNSHLAARFIYLMALFIAMFAAGNLFSTGSRSLADLAKQSTQTFYIVSLAQLILMSFIAPVFTAGAITQEKDANTLHILLTTPLSNAQIVLGTLFSRLFFVWMLLLAGLPIFCITMIYGGVTTREVFESFGLAACTGLVTGSMAILISVSKVGTRRTILAFFLGVATYLLAIGAYGMSPFGALPSAPTGLGSGQQMSWLAAIHPFLSLQVVTGQTPAPTPEAVHAYGWPARWLLAYPQYGYMWLTTLASMAMIATSLFFLRRGALEGETTWFSRLTAVFTRRAPVGERTRKPRHVWSNPIAWREASTRGSAAGKASTRWIMVAVGLAAGLLLLIANEQGWWGLSPGNPKIVRNWLTALIWIELAGILMIVTSAAATTLTREKESQTLEMLLTTPLTSRQILIGMVKGLVAYVLPLIAVPTATLLIFSVADLFRSAPVTHPEAVILVPLLMTAFAAAAAIIGLQQSLNAKKTISAVMISTGIVLFFSGIAWACGQGVLQGGPWLSAFTLPLTPFHSMQVMVDIEALTAATARAVAAGATPPAVDYVSLRIARLVMGLVAVAGYGAVAYWLYHELVRNFDMTIRRQSA